MLRGLTLLLQFLSHQNKNLVEGIAKLVSTIWAVDLVFILVVYPMFIHKGPWALTELVLYLSSSVFQAVMLPVLAYIGDRTEKSQKAQFDRMEKKIDEEFYRVRQVLQEEHSIELMVERVLAELHEIEKNSNK